MYYTPFVLAEHKDFTKILNNAIRNIEEADEHAPGEIFFDEEFDRLQLGVAKHFYKAIGHVAILEHHDFYYGGIEKRLDDLSLPRLRALPKTDAKLPFKELAGLPEFSRVDLRTVRLNF